MFMAAEAELRLNDAGCEGVAASTKQWNKLPYISCSGGEDRSDVCNESKLEAVLAHGDSEQDCSPWLSLSFGGLCVRNMWVSRNHSLWCDRGGHLWGHRRLFVIVVRICYFAHPALLVFLWGTPSLLLAALPVLISRGFLLPAKARACDSAWTTVSSFSWVQWSEEGSSLQPIHPDGSALTL